MKKIDQQIIKKVLKKNKIDYPSRIEEFESGQTNNVYGLDDNYVIRIESDVEYVKGLFNHQIKLESRLLETGALVPKIIDCGETLEKDYMLIEKLPGDNLVNIWFKLTTKQKENFIEQIVSQLKIYHSLKFENYALDMHRGKEFVNYRDAVTEMADFDELDLNKLDERTNVKVDLLKNYFQKNIEVLNEKNTAVLVHNDIQFENIFYQGDKIVGIIDFDLSCAAPKDYELGKMIDFFLYPQNYVRKTLESSYIGKQLTDAWTYYKRHYPEIVKNENLLPRLKYYYIIYMLWVIRECQRDRWGRIPEVLAETRDKIDYIFESGGKFDDFIMT